MLKFHAEDWYDIKDRGRVAAVRNPERFKRDECPYIGQDADIDGVVYRILGVESFALGEIREGAPIGLLVAPKSDDAQGERGGT